MLLIQLALILLLLQHFSQYGCFKVVSIYMSSMFASGSQLPDPN